MPIYEYLCQDCGHNHDALQKMSDAPLTDCPSCGERSLKKAVTAPAFRLKGCGWYETDFKTGPKKNLAQKDSTESGCGRKDSQASSCKACPGE